MGKVEKAGLYILEFPPLVGGGKKSKCLEMGKEIKRGKKRKKGRIHGNPVTDSWAGAVMQKMLAIQKCYKQMDGWTD